MENGQFLVRVQTDAYGDIEVYGSARAGDVVQLIQHDGTVARPDIVALDSADQVRELISALTRCLEVME